MGMWCVKCQLDVDVAPGAGIVWDARRLAGICCFWKGGCVLERECVCTCDGWMVDDWVVVRVERGSHLQGGKL